jgi:hypothetical protein
MRGRRCAATLAASALMRPGPTLLERADGKAAELHRTEENTP